MSLGQLGQWFHKCKKCNEVLLESESHDCSCSDGSDIESNSSLGGLSMWFGRCNECREVEHVDDLVECPECETRWCDDCSDFKKCQRCGLELCYECYESEEIIQECWECCRWFCKSCEANPKCRVCNGVLCTDCVGNKCCDFCERSVKLIQLRYRFIRHNKLKKIRAARFIQLRWKFITGRPSHPLCILRLKNEFKLMTSL